jgi:FkbM family methyltransferase
MSSLMKTSLAEKTRYVEAGSPIREELRLLNPSFILDCGACDGLDSVIYSRLLPNSEIYAIEARRDNYSELTSNIDEFDCKNIVPGNFCLDDQAGVIDFYVSSGQSGKSEWDTGNKSSSMLFPTGHIKEHPWCKFDREKIQAVRFDSLGIKKIDFVHLDVQGAELKVLDGMGEVLDAVKMIWCEVATVSLYDGQPLKAEVEKYLSFKGFKKTKDTSHKFGDQLWQR